MTTEIGVAREFPQRVYRLSPDASKMDMRLMLDLLFKVYPLANGGTWQTIGISIDADTFAALPEEVRAHFVLKPDGA